MRPLILILIRILLPLTLFAQTGENAVPDSIGYSAIQKSAQSFPKFYREFQDIRSKDHLIKKFRFIETKKLGPAFASPKGIITINIAFLNNIKPGFDDNRLIVVLYHEIGHLHYFVTTAPAARNSEDSEKAAFEYSLLKTREIAEKGDCLPLATGVRFMKQRSLSNEIQDPHVSALKHMVTEPLYHEYVKYVNEKCKTSSPGIIPDVPL